MSDNDDEPVRWTRIRQSRETEAYYARYAQKIACTEEFTKNLELMQRGLKKYGTALSPAVVRVIARFHDDMVARLAMIPASTLDELEQKARLLQSLSPAMSENSLLPDIVDTALAENRLRLAIPDPPTKPKPRKR